MVMDLLSIFDLLNDKLRLCARLTEIRELLLILELSDNLLLTENDNVIRNVPVFPNKTLLVIDFVPLSITDLLTTPLPRIFELKLNLDVSTNVFVLVKTDVIDIFCVIVNPEVPLSVTVRVNDLVLEKGDNLRKVLLPLSRRVTVNKTEFVS
jgi:hypothetical protein